MVSAFCASMLSRLATLYATDAALDFARLTLNLCYGVLPSGMRAMGRGYGDRFASAVDWVFGAVYLFDCVGV
jgi:hypothetical protein